MAGLNILLNSDYLDFYDHEFCSRHVPKIDRVFERIADSPRNMPKLEQFELIKRFQLAREVPEYGKPADLIGKLEPHYYVVVYHDQLSHRGEGKELMKLERALAEFPDSLCSEFIGFPGKSVWSIRHLQIGWSAFKLRYTGISNGEESVWRSNYADEVNIEYLGTAMPFRMLDNVKYPLFAVDSVMGYGVDFNTAPQIRGTPLEDILTPIGVYNMLSEVIEQGYNGKK